MVHDVPVVFLNGERPGTGVVYKRLFAEIGPRHLRHERADAFVVHDLGVRGEENVDFSLDVALQKARNFGVEPILVHPLVDDVYPAAGRVVHQVPVAVYIQFFRLGEHRVHLFGVDVVVEVELIFWAAGDDGEGRFRAFRGGGP